MKIYLKSGKTIRVSRDTGVKIMEEIFDDKNSVVTKRRKNEILELYRLDEIAVVK